MSASWNTQMQIHRCTSRGSLLKTKQSVEFQSQMIFKLPVLLNIHRAPLRRKRYLLPRCVRSMASTMTYDWVRFNFPENASAMELNRILLVLQSSPHAALDWRGPAAFLIRATKVSIDIHSQFGSTIHHILNYWVKLAPPIHLLLFVGVAPADSSRSTSNRVVSQQMAYLAAASHIQTSRGLFVGPIHYILFTSSDPLGMSEWIIYCHKHFANTRLLANWVLRWPVAAYFKLSGAERDLAIYYCIGEGEECEGEGEREVALSFWYPIFYGDNVL